MLNDLALVKFLDTSTGTRLVYRLAAQTTEVLDGLVGLLFEGLHLLLLVVGQNGRVFYVRAHCASLLLPNVHLRSLVRVLRVTEPPQLLLVTQFRWLPRCHHWELALVTHLIGKHLVGV